MKNDAELPETFFPELSEFALVINNTQPQDPKNGPLYPTRRVTLFSTDEQENQGIYIQTLTEANHDKGGARVTYKELLAQIAVKPFYLKQMHLHAQAGSNPNSVIVTFKKQDDDGASALFLKYLRKSPHQYQHDIIAQKFQKPILIKAGVTISWEMPAHSIWVVFLQEAQKKVKKIVQVGKAPAEI